MDVYFICRMLAVYLGKDGMLSVVCKTQEPRVSPPWTLGDILAKATYRSSALRHRLSSPVRQQGSPFFRSTVTKMEVSKKFEKPRISSAYRTDATGLGRVRL